MPSPMPRTTWTALLLLAPVVAVSSTILGQAQAKTFALESIAGLRLHNVKAEPATLQGKKGIQVTRSPEAGDARYSSRLTAAVRRRSGRVAASRTTASSITA